MLNLKQVTKYSEAEVELLKRLFGGETPLYEALRNKLYQYPLREELKSLLKFSSDELKLLRKVFLPENYPETPLGWVLNMYQGLKKIEEYSISGAALHINAHDLLIQYLEQQFKEIETGKVGTIVLSELPKFNGELTEEDRVVKVIAFNRICEYIENRLIEIKANANPAPELTEAQKKEKAQKDSTR